MADPTKRVNYEEVARLAREAFDKGVSARGYVARYYGWTPKRASMMIYRARLAGESIPDLPRIPRVRTPLNTLEMQQTVLICDSCAQHFKVTEPRELARHTAIEHKRVPTRTERTPIIV